MTEIELKFLLSQEEVVIKCVRNEKLINMVDVYCQIKNIKKDSIFFLYNGNRINDFNMTIEELGNTQSKKDNKIEILVEHLPKSVLIVFSHLNDLYKKEKDIEENISSVFYDYLREKKIDRNNVILRYGDQVVDPNQTINQFITKYNINLSENKGKNIENLNEIKLDVIDIHEVKIISFSYQNKEEDVVHGLEKNMGDIFNDYASKKELDIKKVEFKYNGVSIKKNQSLDEFIKNNITNKNEKFQEEATLDNTKEIVNNENESQINIDVIDLSYLSYFFKNYKIPLFIIIGVILIAGLTALIVLLLKKDKNGSSSISSRNPIIIPDDYFINATYFSNKSETVRLISDEYDLNKIKNMSIDGKIINPTKFYTFNDYGHHNIYCTFNNISEKSIFSERRGIFNGVTKLIYIKVSDFNKNHPDVSFHGMFNNCISLLSADFSAMKPISYSYPYYFYYNSTDYMFNNCTSLISINLDFKGASKLYGYC